jgi:hypothetical protein
MRDVYYLYLVSSEGNDYVTISFNWKHNSLDEDYFEVSILSFFEESIDEYEYLVFDSTSGKSGNIYYDDSWQNSKYIKYYKIIKKDLDKPRGTLNLLIREAEPIDLQSYRRSCKIHKVIGSQI